MSALSKLLEGKPLGKEEWLSLITDTKHAEEIREEACRKRDEIYGRKIFLRILIPRYKLCDRPSLILGRNDVNIKRIHNGIA